MAAAARKLLPLSFNQTRLLFPLPPTKYSLVSIPGHGGLAKPRRGLGFEVTAPAKPRASPAYEGTVQGDGDDGVSLGTLKLPPSTDVDRFETLLFQWANSLCQGANLPLPVPLKVDKVQGGARLGFVNIEDGKAEVFVYIDCLVYPSSDSSVHAGPVFRAIRNGPLKDKIPPGEERIMRSQLQALLKSVETSSS